MFYRNIPSSVFSFFLYNSNLFPVSSIYSLIFQVFKYLHINYTSLLPKNTINLNKEIMHKASSDILYFQNSRKRNLWQTTLRKSKVQPVGEISHRQHSVVT